MATKARRKSARRHIAVRGMDIEKLRYFMVQYILLIELLACD